MRGERKSRIGYRMLVAFRSKSRAVFLYGFPKNERDNIDNDELATLQDIATAWLAADPDQIDRARSPKGLYRR